MTPEDAFKLLETIAVISDTRNKLVKISQPANAAVANAKKKKPPINFAKCNIPVGAVLVYTEDPSVQAIVQDERKVLYNDEITSLSNIVQTIKNMKSAAGPSYFTYNGVPIVEIASHTQWKNFFD